MLIVEYRETNLMSLAFFLFHYLMLKMFRMLIHPSSGEIKYNTKVTSSWFLIHSVVLHVESMITCVAVESAPDNLCLSPFFFCLVVFKLHVSKKL